MFHRVRFASNPLGFGAAVTAAAALVAALSASIWSPAAPPVVTQLEGLLPRGSLQQGMVRLEMDGSPPLETAVVAVVPAFPGAAQGTYYGFIFGFDRWRRRYVRLYANQLPGAIPLSPDAVPIAAGREAAIFGALRDDGRRVYRIVESVRGLLMPLDDSVASRMIAELPMTPPSITWRYRVRAGATLARTAMLRVRPRQPVRLEAIGGGPTPIVIVDSRLDLVEQGYRARWPGRYAIRILRPFAPDQDTTLTIIVESP